MTPRPGLVCLLYKHMQIVFDKFCNWCSSRIPFLSIIHLRVVSDRKVCKFSPEGMSDGKIKSRNSLEDFRNDSLESKVQHKQ